MLSSVLYFCVCFFKQKTAYEMRISDWSSDVCSSDLAATCAAAALALAGCGGGKKQTGAVMAPSQVTTIGVNSYLWRASLDSLSFMPLLQSDSAGGEIGRASCRERVCQYV